jgi:hypothetical protein
VARTGKIEPFFPRIRYRKMNLCWTRETARELRATGAALDAEVADVIERTLDDPGDPRREGCAYQAFLLTLPDGLGDSSPRPRVSPTSPHPHAHGSRGAAAGSGCRAQAEQLIGADAQAAVAMTPSSCMKATGSPQFEHFSSPLWSAMRTFWWLASLEALERYPAFRAELEAALLEADLVLAMVASRFDGRVYSRGHDRATVQRLTARVDDSDQRRAFEQLFPGEGNLEERLEEAYATASSAGRRDCSTA